MHNQERNVGPDEEYIVPLYRLAISNVSQERIADWLALQGLRYSNQQVRRTLKRANRDDLIEFLIQEEDIKIGDTIKSRSTSRIGKVIGIHSDGGTIDVRWDAGGTQPLSKESVFKMRTQEERGFSKVHSEYETYAGTMGEERNFERPDDSKIIRR